jgi:hypothetical protein
MNKRLISRRHLLISGLVGCSAMMTGVALPSSEEPPSGYIRPGPDHRTGKGPRPKNPAAFTSGRQNLCSHFREE